jgi:fatty acid desaturase
MEATFHDSVPPELLRDLSQHRNGPGLIRLTLQVAVAVASGALLVLASEPWTFALGLGLQAGVQLTFFATLHECVHRTAFRARWLNHLGAWLAAPCQLMAPPLMRVFHFEHHRHTHDLERDPELAGLEFMAAWPRGLVWLGTVTGLPVLFARVAMTLVSAVGAPRVLASRLLPYVRANRRWGVVGGSLLLVGVHAAFVAAALHLEPRLLRLYLGVVLAHAFLAVYITCEHRGLPTEGTILERTRSFDPGLLGKWCMWNMPYHAEHHAYPAVPFHALPELHTALKPQLVHPAGGVIGLHLRSGRAP